MGRILQGTLEQLGGEIVESQSLQSFEVQSPVEIIKEIEKIVEVPVETIVEKQVIQIKESIQYVNVPVEKIVEVIKEVPVEIIKEVKVLDKELLEQEVAKLDARLKEMNSLIQAVPPAFDDKNLKLELHKLKQLNVKLLIIIGVVSIMALAGMVL